MNFSKIFSADVKYKFFLSILLIFLSLANGIEGTSTGSRSRGNNGYTRRINPYSHYNSQKSKPTSYNSIPNNEHSYWVLRSRALNTAKKYVGSRCPFKYPNKESFTAKRKSSSSSGKLGQNGQSSNRKRKNSKEQVWVNMIMEVKDAERCPDSVYKWSCLVQFKYKSSGVLGFGGTNSEKNKI